ncbi:putative glycolipid-binding domain-containing protein [Celeribacter sp. ULVN23_4]
MTMRIAARWSAYNGRGDSTGHEHCVFSVGEDEVSLKAALSGAGKFPFGAQYHLKADPQFRTRELWVEYVGKMVLHIASDGQGNWFDLRSESPLPELDGCLDADIAVTPATNMLPIRRLKLAAGETQEIAVAFVPPPGEIGDTFRPRKVMQRYTCLSPARAYLYENLTSGFAAEIKVDGHGLVTDYPGAYCRL